MRVLLRSGPLLLALGLAVIGCNRAGSPPATGPTAAPAKPPAASPDKPAPPVPSQAAAGSMQYVLTVQGMS
jgi:hypothetical protein